MRKIKKISTCIALLGIIMVPTVANASSRLSWGYYHFNGYYQGWAKKDYTTIWAQIITTEGQSGRVWGWQSTCTKEYPGELVLNNAGE